MDLFNNREIATAIWLSVLLGFALTKSDVRKSLAGVARSFFRPKIIVLVFFMVLYTAAAAMLLSVINFWNICLLKDTIAWFCLSSIIMTMNFVTAKEDKNIFRKILVDSIKIVVVLEFLVNTYTFPLAAELVIVPILSFIAMVDFLANTDEKYSAVAKLTGALQVVFGLAILAFVASRVISDLHSLQNFDTIRSIILSPLFSVLLFPFIYVMVLISKYELVFLRLDFGSKKDRRLKRYAWRRILMYARFSLRKLQKLLNCHAIDLMHVDSKTDIDNLLQARKDADSGFCLL